MFSGWYGCEYVVQANDGIRGSKWEVESSDSSSRAFQHYTVR